MTVRVIHEELYSYVSILSIDAFTNVLLNVLFNAMANVAIYNIMHNDANTKHDHNVIVQTVIFAHTVKTNITMNLII